MYKRIVTQLALIGCVVIFSLGVAQQHPQSVSAQTAQEAIAYIRSNDVTGDEIRLVNPDGTGNHMIWRSGVAGAQGVADVSQLAWRPDARELAFASFHEGACSFYDSDIYAIRPDGTGYHRVTAPPACGQHAGLPTGTVRVEFDNYTETSGPFILYFEGAPQAATVTVAPNQGVIVTFSGVADYGDQILQWAVATTLTTVDGEATVARYHSVQGHADVLPGQPVEADGPVIMSYPSEHWGWSDPTWRSDSSEIAYFFGADTIYAIGSANTTPGAIGSKLLNLSGTMPLGTKYLRWAPTAARANQLLYSAWALGQGTAIFLVQEGSTTPGQVIVPVDTGNGETVLGLAWLPDGSGFLYSKTEQFNDIANLYEYRFASGQSTRLTDFNQGWTRAAAFRAKWTLTCVEPPAAPGTLAPQAIPAPSPALTEMAT